MNTESPIEAILAKAFDDHFVEPELQYPIANFRVDFCFPEAKLIIEADGHEFHSSKEQMTKDYRRQRVLQRMGWTVYRFTGQEIYRDPDKCVTEIKMMLRRLSATVDLAD